MPCRRYRRRPVSAPFSPHFSGAATIDVVAPSDDEQLELQQAADALGVHYQTAYRWVRTGRLPASLVRGRYCVARHDLASVEAELRTPTARRPPGIGRLQAQQRRMYEALVDGDEPRARHIASQLATEGTKVVVLLQRVLVPALRQMGDGWHRGDVPIWAEHRASAIAERILGDLVPNPRGRRRGVVAPGRTPHELLDAAARDVTARRTTCAGRHDDPPRPGRTPPPRPRDRCY